MACPELVEGERSGIEESPACGGARFLDVEALSTIQPSGPFERALARLQARMRGLRSLTSVQSGNILCARDQEEPPPLGPLAGAARARESKG